MTTAETEPGSDRPARKYIDVRVTSRNDDDLTAFIQLCKTIEYCSGVGASRSITVAVDGDGSADLRFDFKETDVEGVDPAISDDHDDGEGAVIAIGE